MAVPARPAEDRHVGAPAGWEEVEGQWAKLAGVLRLAVGLAAAAVFVSACSADDANSSLSAVEQSTTSTVSSQTSTTSVSRSSSTPSGTSSTSSTTTAPSPTTEGTPAPEPSAEPADASGGDEAPVLQLRGRSFAGDTVMESGHAKPLVMGTELTVWFHRNEHSGEDIVAWSGGCNSSGGAVAVTSDRLDVTSDGASSAAGCTEDRHAQDAWLSRFFNSDPYWSLKDGVLRLMSGETVVVLDERAGDH